MDGEGTQLVPVEVTWGREDAPVVIRPEEFAYRHQPRVEAEETVTVQISFPAGWLPLIESFAEQRRRDGDGVWFGQIMQKICIAHARGHEGGSQPAQQG